MALHLIYRFRQNFGYPTRNFSTGHHVASGEDNHCLQGKISGKFRRSIANFCWYKIFKRRPFLCYDIKKQNSNEEFLLIIAVLYKAGIPIWNTARERTLAVAFASFADCFAKGAFDETQVKIYPERCPYPGRR